MTKTGQKEDTMLDVVGRHPDVQEFGDMFEFDHLPEGLPRETSAVFHEAAEKVLSLLPDGPSLTRSLHRLWESKNEAVFLAVRTQKGEQQKKSMPQPKRVRS
jgi:hypothetical protein